MEKAENDYLTAVIVLEETDQPIADTACFHCQQCAEKYLKGFLSQHRIDFPRRHPLIPLLELCTQIDDEFLTLLTDLRTLVGYAVAARYPGASISIEMARKALIVARRVRTFIRGKLELSTRE